MTRLVVDSAAPDWAHALARDVGAALASISLDLERYTVATLPSLASKRLIFVTDESGGPVPAYSDGTNWRRASDGNVVS